MPAARIRHIMLFRLPMREVVAAKGRCLWRDRILFTLCTRSSFTFAYENLESNRLLSVVRTAFRFCFS